MRTPARVVLCLLLVAACSDGQPAATPSRTISASPAIELPPPPEGGFDPPITVRFAGAPDLKVEVARRPDQRGRGMMQRTNVPDGTGMIFLFPRRGDGGFHMLGCLVPLSIAWVDGTTVVATTEMEPCPPRSAKCPAYSPGAAYTLAVEATAGFFPFYGVKPGTRVTVEGTYEQPI